MPISFRLGLAMSALCVVLLPAATAQTAPAKALTIEAIFQPGGLTGRGPENLAWSPDSRKLSYVQRNDTGEQGELWYVDTATGEKKVLVSAAKLASLVPDVNKIKDEREKERLTRYNVAAYVWSPDSQHLIFDALGQLWLYDLNSATAVQFTSAPEPSEDPKFSPDGGHIAYVRQHNLYVRPISGNKEKQLTKDKGENLFNGDIDWVYAEELGVRSNYFWSPDNRQIVFLHMDENNVPTYPITDWSPRHPTVYNEKYPKVGDPNPAVKLAVVDVDKGKTRWISVTNDEDTYLPRFGWLRPGVIWAQLLNRAQDKLDLYFVDAKSGKSRLVLTENTPGAWIDFEHLEAKFLKSGDRFVWPSWRDGHMHLYLYGVDQQNPLSDAKLERQLTKGDFEVLEIEGVDEKSGTLFFMTNKGDPRQSQIDSVSLDGNGFKALTSGEGLHFGSFSEDGKHYVDTFLGADTAPQLSFCSVERPCAPIWTARNAVADYGLRQLKYLEFKADDGTTLYGRLLLPPEASAGAKIPLLVSIYGGPAAQMVLKTTPDAFDEILSRKGFAVFAVDNRGTPGRDRKFQTAIRHEFGAIELKDQIAALDQLLAQYPQLDKDRVGIWGWSNGGSMTLYAMTHSDRFRAGVAGAPVTDARNYDSIYMERYLGLLKENPKSYEQSDVTSAASQLHGALLLIHGTGDDNVHFQNSVQMIDALISAGKQFRLMIYPNKTHSVSGDTTRVHMSTMIVDHFERELK